jgi:L-lactate utilization protein LutC
MEEILRICPIWKKKYKLTYIEITTKTLEDFKEKFIKIMINETGIKETKEEELEEDIAEENKEETEEDYGVLNNPEDLESNEEFIENTNSDTDDIDTDDVDTDDIHTDDIDIEDELFNDV